MLCKFESLKGPLRDHISDLVRQLAEAEEEVESAKMVIKKRDDALARLQVLKGETDETIDLLRTDLVSAQKKNEAEVEKLCDQITNLHDMIDQLLDENGKLRGGEGVDLEAIIDSD